jgi:tRNA dimethylallyltransferase
LTLAQIDPKNRLRVIRSIEIAKALGKVPAIEKRNDYDVLTIGLDTDDAILKERIYRRILARIKKGMIREAERVHESGVPWKRMRELGLEYGLLANLLQKKMTREQFVERLNYDIWHYVRRQRAWFKRDQRTKWFDPKDAEKIEGAVKGFLALTSSQNV